MAQCPIRGVTFRAGRVLGIYIGLHRDTDDVGLQARLDFAHPPLALVQVLQLLAAVSRQTAVAVDHARRRGRHHTADQAPHTVLDGGYRETTRHRDRDQRTGHTTGQTRSGTDDAATPHPRPLVGSEDFVLAQEPVQEPAHPAAGGATRK
ncbi:hypothetical protein GCM10011588_11450 [Nocardia jinanensis]|uniref:Uncharacterized protein n=1 Tax=Nocardia jinanensis TaxID=382504 RepID=A0A917RBC6_9NOCA|nr:hypothetical protein GCM10011588_11450 [Nocardia jinanensis]